MTVKSDPGFAQVVQRFEKCYTVIVVGDTREAVDEGLKDLGLMQESAPSLRTPPEVEVAPTPPPVVESRESGPVCQECGDPIAPLSVEDAKDLYGLQVCIPCGKLIQ